MVPDEPFRRSIAWYTIASRWQMSSCRSPAMLARAASCTL